ncbi:MAG: hypothetical protein K2K38_01830, partial [Clostridia bacterium]|nr:hypothetical protein [Clostridia bacterium]
MKKGNGNNKIAKQIALIVLIIGVFVLFVFALLRQYQIYSGKFPAISSGIKYLYIALVVMLPVLLILLIRASFSKRDNTDLITPDYFDVDFKKLEKEKKALQSFDVPKSAIVEVPVNNYAPARAVSAPAPAEETEAAEEVNEGGSRFYMLTEIDKEYE